MIFHGPPPQSLTAAASWPISSTLSVSPSMASLFRHSSKENKPCGRRSLFSFLAAATALPQVTSSKSALLQEYLKRSRENKEKHDKERRDEYYKRNYRDYFELVEGYSKDKGEDLLTETEKEIRQWLKRNSK
ncbi:hypothetical protein KSP39_PZI012029 [Platanthera zijinensis]|uniref:Uncharacterized protein n=1 Tax=Platanthera zijinensis TaxID=2320716 RepID=A0AAP0BEG9_9ASPA